MSIERIISRTRMSGVSFFWDGRIDISSGVSRAIGLCAGDVINIARTEGPVPEYYLYVEHKATGVHGRHRCACRPTHGRGNSMRAHNASLSRHMIKASGGGTQARLGTGPAEAVSGIGPCVPIIVMSNHQSE